MLRYRNQSLFSNRCRREATRSDAYRPIVAITQTVNPAADPQIAGPRSFHRSIRGVTLCGPALHVGATQTGDLGAGKCRGRTARANARPPHIAARVCSTPRTSTAVTTLMGHVEPVRPPVPGDHGAHGRFDAHARDRGSIAPRRRSSAPPGVEAIAVAVLGAGLAGAIAGAMRVLRRRQSL